MSNQVIGPVYLSIIEKIVADSKEDFEAAGLDQETLQELKKQWQQNISALEIAHCPWDPPPPQPQISNPPTVPSNVKPEQPYKHDQYKNDQYKPDQYKNDMYKGEPSGGQNGGHRPQQPRQPIIKQEIQYETDVQNYPPQQPQPGYNQGGLNPQVAQQRANHLLQQQYGNHANASIQAAQARQMPVPHGQRPQHIQLPGPPRPGQPQYPQHQQSNLGSAQTDGGTDDAMSQWKATVADRRARSEEDRQAADGMLRERMEQDASFLESGLMMSLSEKPRKSKKRRNAPSSSLSTSDSVAHPSSIPQLDGGKDEDEDEKKPVTADEDAINSDLDDSDEGDNDDGDDDDAPLGETILCTYDKVQRVKNKWKCTLKDGILTTNKKEYVFHKAQGEFEW